MRPRRRFHASAVDRDSLDLGLRVGALRQRDGQHAVLERSGDLILLDLVAERDAPLEAAIETLREMAVLVGRLGALLAAQSERVVIEQHFYVLLVEAGDLGG